MALGLARALSRDHVEVGYVKPILQPADLGRADLAPYFARSLLHLNVPEPMPFEAAEERVRSGGLDAFLEDLVDMVEEAGAGCDAVVVEGLIPDASLQIASGLNAAMTRALSASLVPVLAGNGNNEAALAGMVDLALRQFAESEEPPPLAGVLINRVHAPVPAPLFGVLHGSGGDMPLLGDIPYAPALAAVRLQDVCEALALAIVQEGALKRSRVRDFVIAGSGVDALIDRLRPGVLVLAAGDRSDIVLACGLAYVQGMQLAGLLLTGSTQMSSEVASLLRGAKLAELPILSTPDDTFEAATKLAGLSHHVRAEDFERMEQAIKHAADHIDTTVLRGRISRPGQLRMPPPAFRHRLVLAARAANKRIVLPEGDEPRTVQAAATCQRRGIAHCVMLARPDAVRRVADEQGVALPNDIEIIDPPTIRDRYIAPMVELRSAKGLTANEAAVQLEDNVVLGTMMLAEGDVDGLVSGAVHTTANTIRPALQLIRKAPGVSLVSSIFFMLMPNDVLVYGDCAVNPDPNAEELADIALQSSESARAFGIEPRVAMISYSTGTSGGGADVDKVARALEIARARRPELLIDGPLQYDAASVESVGRQKAPGSKVAGHANVFIFPDLNTGNTTYKAVQRSAHVISIGPMLQGLRKPVNDLSRGALVDDIIFTIALTAIQAVQAAQAAQAPALQLVK
jgi:phosphate acetyltransferase